MDQPIMLFPINMAELQQFIKTTIQDAVRIAATPTVNPAHPEILTKKEAVQFLGKMSVPTFDRLVKEGKIHEGYGEKPRSLGRGGKPCRRQTCKLNMA